MTKETPIDPIFSEETESICEIQSLALQKSENSEESNSIECIDSAIDEENTLLFKIGLLNEDQKNAFDLFMRPETQTMYIGGFAGTGKSFLLNIIVQALTENYKDVAVTAPTGSAAFNIHGVTIHSFSSYPVADNVSIEKVIENVKKNKAKAKNWRKTDVLIIDEISMVSAEFLDNLEKMARGIRNSDEPFGGIKTLFFGDFLQLPPVKNTKYAFESNFWKKNIKIEVLLKKNVRQKDDLFSRMLGEIRVGKLSKSTINFLEEKSRNYKSANYFSPETLKALSAKRTVPASELFQPTKLRATKREVETINTKSLSILPGSTICVTANDWISKGTYPNIFGESGYPAMLRIKVNCQIVVLKNISVKKGIFNGSLGIVRKIFLDSVEIDDTVTTIQPEQIEALKIQVELMDSKTVYITPDTYEYKQNHITVAKRTQLPIDLAYSMTIHKCQGQTLDQVDVDLSNTFECGQIYVALSRSRTLEGLNLSGFDASKIHIDGKCIKFYDDIDDDIEEEVPPKKILPPPPVVVQRRVECAIAPLNAQDYLPGLKKYLGIV